MTASLLSVEPILSQCSSTTITTNFSPNFHSNFRWHDHGGMNGDLIPANLMSVTPQCNRIDAVFEYMSRTSEIFVHL